MNTCRSGATGKKESLEEVVLRRLRRYETQEDRRLARRVDRLQGAVTKQLLSDVPRVLGLKAS